MPKHIHADLMMKAAEIAQTDCEWWTYFQFRLIEPSLLDDNGNHIWCGWEDWDRPFIFADASATDIEYRLKPRTIKIGSIDIPEPVREYLSDNDEYYIPAVDGILSNTYSKEWFYDERDLEWLRRGLVHSDKESAELHAKALIALTAK